MGQIEARLSRPRKPQPSSQPGENRPVRVAVSDGWRDARNQVLIDVARRLWAPAARHNPPRERYRLGLLCELVAGSEIEVRATMLKAILNDAPMRLEFNLPPQTLRESFVFAIDRAT